MASVILVKIITFVVTRKEKNSATKDVLNMHLHTCCFCTTN